MIWAQAGVSGRQERLQVWGEFVQLHGKSGEAIIQQVILRLWIFRTTTAPQVNCSTNVTLGFIVTDFIGIRLKR